eukprot:6255432-Amphidinium_carterae.1
MTNHWQLNDGGESMLCNSKATKAWIMCLHSARGARMVKIGKHFYIHSLVMDGFIHKVQTNRSQINASLPSESYNGICGSDMTTHEEESDQQHAED